MKQFDRTSLEQYRRNPRGNNTIYKNYSNPAMATSQIPGFEKEMSSSYTGGIDQGIPIGANQAMENINQAIPENLRSLLPSNMAAFNPEQLLSELRRSYEGNLNINREREAFINNYPQRFSQYQVEEARRAAAQNNPNRSVDFTGRAAYQNVVNQSVPTMFTQLQGGNFNQDAFNANVRSQAEAAANQAREQARIQMETARAQKQAQAAERARREAQQRADADRYRAQTQGMNFQEQNRLSDRITAATQEALRVFSADQQQRLRSNLPQITSYDFISQYLRARGL